MKWCKKVHNHIKPTTVCIKFHPILHNNISNCCLWHACDLTLCPSFSPNALWKTRKRDLLISPTVQIWICLSLWQPLHENPRKQTLLTPKTSQTRYPEWILDQFSNTSLTPYWWTQMSWVGTPRHSKVVDHLHADVVSLCEHCINFNYHQVRNGPSQLFQREAVISIIERSQQTWKHG